MQGCREHRLLDTGLCAKDTETVRHKPAGAQDTARSHLYRGDTEIVYIIRICVHTVYREHLDG